MAPIITYCTTVDDASRAATILSRSPIIILDCEARELGMPGGALSLLALSTASASHVFLLDALALPSLPPALLTLLSGPSPTKVVWDGRGDALELRLTYGLVLGGVLDLQVVDVVARQRAAEFRGDGALPQDLLQGYFKQMRAVLEADPAAYAGIWRLRGLSHVVGFYGLAGKDGKDLKDPEVVAMHQQNGSELWMARPLPERLIQYAAHDLELIARVYAHFMRKGWVRSSQSALEEKSLAYVSMFTSREHHARFRERDLKRFMPFGFIEDGARNAPRYSCAGCERELTADCFTKKLTKRDGGGRGGRGKNVLQRMSLCRLCNAIAQRNEEPQGEWVDFGV